MNTPEHAASGSRLAWAAFVLALLLLATTWGIFGTRFYDQVLPFFDSASYQEGYRSVAVAAGRNGTMPTLASVWKEPAGNVVLYRFFAAVAGPWLPQPRTGLLVYLFCFHLAAGIALATAVRTITGRFLPAFAAVAVWFLTKPFGLLRDGVGDQRMDLSSGSAFLLVCALGLRWTHAPSHAGAFLTGTAATLAALHRPILVPAIAVMGLLLALFALVQHRRPAGQWLLSAGLALLPIAAVAAPWFLRHYDDLRVYYLEIGPDVGASISFQAAAWFHWRHFQAAVGLPATLVLVAGLLVVARQMQFHPGRALFVLLALVCPLAVLVGFKSTGNVYVQQAALGMPALLFAAWKPRQDADRFLSSWDIGLGCLFLASAVVAAPLRLTQSLAREEAGGRQEAVRLLKQITAISPGTRLAGFHDLPVSPMALCMVARDLDLPLEPGVVSYYPSDFGLSNDRQSDIESARVKAAVAARLAFIKQHDHLIILPSADTTFRLWAGLYSHRLIPLIRAQIEQDKDLEGPQRVGPVKEVYFDVYRIRR